MTAQAIPLKPATSQRLVIALGTRTYRLTLKWNRFAAAWVLDVADSLGQPLALGLAVVTGADLLGQLEYIGVAGGLAAASDDDVDAVPTFANLGAQGHVYFLS